MRVISKIRRKAATMTLGEMAAEALSQVNKRVVGSYRRVTDRKDSTFITDDELSRSIIGQDLSALLQSFRAPGRPRLTAGLVDLKSTVRHLSRIYPLAPHDTISRAAAVLDHKITLFGRGFSLGGNIDWQKDPASGVRWPLVHYTRVPIVMGSGGDARVVWELNRMHHLVTLGQAYAYTHDERFTEEFLIQLSGWYEQNPPKFGINWTVAMEAAIRSVNIIAALDLFRDSRLLDPDSFALIVKVLIAHGRYIEQNLETTPTFASNHYLSDLIGLFVIGATLPELADSMGWVGTGVCGLLQGMDCQILADGVNYEGTTAYHRFVIELYFLFIELSSRQIGRPR